MLYTTRSGKALFLGNIQCQALGGAFDGVLGFAKEWLEAWEEFHVEQEEFIDGGDAVVTKVRYWGRGRGSGVEVTDRWFYAYRLRDGKVISWRPYADRNEALKAVGLVQ